MSTDDEDGERTASCRVGARRPDGEGPREGLSFLRPGGGALLVAPLAAFAPMHAANPAPAASPLTHQETPP